jgi:hypothetical protein
VVVADFMAAVGLMAFVDRARIINVLAVAAVWAAVSGPAIGQNPPSPSVGPAATGSSQETFATPEAAVKAVADALAADDTTKLLDIFGHDHEAVVLGADPASGRVMRQHAAEALNQKVGMRHEGPNKIILIASNGWPMPIPLVRHVRDGCSIPRRPKKRSWLAASVRTNCRR